MKHKLYMMIGCPGVGKSTFCKNHITMFGDDVKYVSRDDIRFSIVKEDEEYFSHETEVFNKFIDEIKDGLKNAEATIADATHINSGSRTKLLRKLGDSLKDCEVIAVVLRNGVDTCIRQNEKRKNTRSYVPRDVIENMYEHFRSPSFDEGFDKIIVIYSNGEIVIKENSNV